MSIALEEAVELVDLYETYLRTHRLEHWESRFYPWQRETFASDKPEAMLLAGNRTGKSLTAGAWFAIHALEEYPTWWEGPRYHGGLRMWALGVSSTQLRDVIQLELFGNMTENGFDGTGFIPRERIHNVVKSGTTKDLCSEVMVRRSNGQLAKISLKAYTQSATGQGTLTLAGSSVDLIWVDEQPPDDVVSQLRTRTMTGLKGKGGRILFSLTAELGETELVRQFLRDRKDHQFFRQVSWDDCPHLTQEVQQQILETIPEWQHDMRRTGMPLMGTGLIYSVPESRLMVESFEIPSWYKRLKAIDLGYSHPTALAWMALNPETDVLYLVRSYAKSGELPAYHTQTARSMWPDIPTVFPHDGDNTEKGSGVTMSEIYRDAGIGTILSFSNPDGSRYVEPGIVELSQRMRSDRFRVFAGDDNHAFWDEKRRYHRDDKGKIVKLDDDVMDAVRYCTMMIAQNGKNAADLTPYEPKRRPVVGGWRA